MSTRPSGPPRSPLSRYLSLRQALVRPLGVAAGLAVVIAGGAGRAQAPPKRPSPPPATTARPQPPTSAPALSQAPPKVELEGNALRLPGPLLFRTGSDVLEDASASQLQLVADYLASKPYVTLLRIEGHTDGSGPAAQALSERRALSVARRLVEAGVACQRLLPVGFGGTKPVAPATTPEGRAQNARISFVNAALRGRPIGGLEVSGGAPVAGDPCRK